MLHVQQLHQYYGGSHILRGLSFEARVGEVTCLLGRNGVGKTTLLKCLMGLIPAKSGAVTWEDRSITALKPHQRVQAGIAYVPQGREIFGRLSVEENLLMGLSRFGAKQARAVPEFIYELFPLSNGNSIVKGKKVTSFSNAEEDAVDLSKYMPFMLETRLGELGATFSKAENWQEHVVVSWLDCL